MRGTPAAYEALLRSPQKPNNDTLYFISEPDSNDADLYLGSKLIAGGSGSEIIASLAGLSDIIFSSDLADGQILVYDASLGKWVNSSLDGAIATFLGATEDTPGLPGLVPAPGLGQTNLFLKSDGSWAEIHDAADSNILIIENEDSSKLHQDIIDKATADLLILKGDIIIIKDLIADDRWQHTSYVYNGASWSAMDGNYNAENVYFDEDFVFTEQIGTVVIPSSGSTTVEASGKNIKNFLATLFAKEENPSTTLPTVSFSQPTVNKSVEVGTEVEVQYSVSFNEGAYSYDDSTGVTVTEWNVYDNQGNQKTEASGKMPKVQITDGMTYSISATAKYSDGIIPSTNMGNSFEEGQIKEGTTEVAKSKTVSGYRKMFAGMDKSGAELTSDWVRDHLNSVNNTITWAAADLPGVKRFIVAIPANSGKTITEALITSSMNANATEHYIKQEKTIPVKGANDFDAIEYNVWIYEPSSIASVEVHKITIG